jgi:hypothetical protein
MKNSASNLRQLLDTQAPYHTINREERNLAAIFYHVLLYGDNLQKFLGKFGFDFSVKENEMGIYFEYAFLRDLWKTMGVDNDKKRRVILELLQPENRDFLEGCSIEAFNSYFGAVPRPSKTDIQSPSNWSIPKYNSNITSNQEFLKVSKFKWSFNAKPDIVIHTSFDEAICIEAKYESKEGKYPSNKIEVKIFNGRKLNTIGQLEIQQNIMELLGVNAKFLFLVQKKSGPKKLDGIKELSWKEAFKVMDYAHAKPFIKDWINRL